MERAAKSAESSPEAARPPVAQIGAAVAVEGGAAHLAPGALLPELQGGRPLPVSTRSRLEASFGQPLDGVRIHDDARAAELSAAHNADAFTLGDHVAFAAGRFAPGTPSGDHLLAHEIAHVVQQRGGGGGQVDGGATVSRPHEAVEVEAEAAAHRFSRGEAAGVSARGFTTRARILRQNHGPDSTDTGGGGDGADGGPTNETPNSSSSSSPNESSTTSLPGDTGQTNSGDANSSSTNSAPIEEDTTQANTSDPNAVPRRPNGPQEDGDQQQDTSAQRSQDPVELGADPVETQQSAADGPGLAAYQELVEQARGRIRTSYDQRVLSIEERRTTATETVTAELGAALESLNAGIDADISGVNQTASDAVIAAEDARLAAVQRVSEDGDARTREITDARDAELRRVREGSAQEATLARTTGADEVHPPKRKRRLGGLLA